MSELVLKNVSKSYGSQLILSAIDLAVEFGEFIVFVGPSGCGKSTLLRLIAGLEHTSSGKIFLGQRDITHLPPVERKVAMVFQNYALYPHMTVAENIGFGLRLAGVDRATRQAKVAEVASILRLDALLERKPRALSGGQKQRVAIGRAIVKRPRLFLFDEPLSNLDAELRTQMRVELAKLHRTMGATMIYVTHDQTEAMTMADRIVVLNDGRIEQVGRPVDLYHNPSNRFVASFIGSPKMNFFEIRDGRATQLEDKVLAAPLSASAGAVGIRPESIPHAPSGLAHRGTIEIIERLGHLAYLYVRTSSGHLVTILEGSQTVSAGESVTFDLPPEHLLMFDTDGRRLTFERAA